MVRYPNVIQFYYGIAISTGISKKHPGQSEDSFYFLQVRNIRSSEIE